MDKINGKRTKRKEDEDIGSKALSKRATQRTPMSDITNNSNHSTQVSPFTNIINCEFFHYINFEIDIDLYVLTLKTVL